MSVSREPHYGRKEESGKVSTNYTHLINENLDQFDEFDIIESTEYSNGLGWFETDNGIEYEDDWMPTDEDWEWLHKSESRLHEIIERCGQYGEDEWSEEWGFYSDLYKDIFGSRPRWFRW